MSLHLPHMAFHLPHSNSGALRREVNQLRELLADKDQQLAQMAIALDDALDREQLHSLSAPHERLTPAAVINRYGQPRAHHDQVGTSDGGDITQAGQAAAPRLPGPAVAGVRGQASPHWGFER
ncbi:hypothetical protein [Nocardia brasiliensis]|uniref:hypothetical protein n=1 Tax=Nocardia brasiliensis TaxID=37326 RepID=UPI0024578441|nr:hypothetical protein [Nocardia brasiliensis]